MKDCPASEFGCSCNRCAYEPDDDLEALKQFNRASYTTSMFLILLAVVLGVFAVGLLKTEQSLKRTAIARAV